MDADDRPRAPEAGQDHARPRDFDPARKFDTKDFDRRRRARNWALLAVLLGLAALFYAITLVKLHKGG